MMDDEELLRYAYAAFNARNVDAALATMHPDVEWPNGMEGGTVHGHRGVREYWTRQWLLLEQRVQHVYRIEDRLIRGMEIRDAAPDA
jgi:ketosteroid isomerase-like protein